MTVAHSRGDARRPLSPSGAISGARRRVENDGECLATARPSRRMGELIVESLAPTEILSHCPCRLRGAALPLPSRHIRRVAIGTRHVGAAAFARWSLL